MALLKNERTEWLRVQRLGKKHGLLVKRVGPANVTFPGLHDNPNISMQLGTGGPTRVMKARVDLKRKGFMFKEFNEW